MEIQDKAQQTNDKKHRPINEQCYESYKKKSEMKVKCNHTREVVFTQFCSLY